MKCLKGNEVQLFWNQIGQTSYELRDVFKSGSKVLERHFASFNFEARQIQLNLPPGAQSFLFLTVDWDLCPQLRVICEEYPSPTCFGDRLKCHFLFFKVS